jgi:hypothetical protein
MRLVLLIILFLSMFAPSCQKYQPATPAFFIKPSYIAVAPTAGQGTASHHITDLWLYVNGQFQGAYPDDAILPIVNGGKTATINIFAGIKNNGISTTRVPWQFYQRLDLDTIAPAGTTINMPVIFKYSSATTFTWTENFDGNTGYTLRKTYYSDTTFTAAAPSDNFEGRSIEIGLNAPQSLAQVESSGTGFSLPAATSNVYLEINYKCNHVFSVGLIGDDEILRPVLDINPKQEWNKIYIQLAQAVNSPAISSRYRVYFRMVRGESENNLKMFLDNIKLVYLQ